MDVQLFPESEVIDQLCSRKIESISSQTSFFMEGKLGEDRGAEFQTTVRESVGKEVAALEESILENSSGQKFPSFLEIESNIVPVKGKFNSKDQFTGVGQKYSKSGKLIFQGNFLKDKNHGFGIKYRQSGTLLYKGEFKNNEFHGTGIKYFDSKESDSEIPENYVGSFSEGKFTGQGIKFSNTGITLYYGFFDAGKYSGRGILYNENTSDLLYDGNFLDNKYHGLGIKYRNGIKVY